MTTVAQIRQRHVEDELLDRAGSDGWEEAHRDRGALLAMLDAMCPHRSADVHSRIYDARGSRVPAAGQVWDERVRRVYDVLRDSDGVPALYRAERVVDALDYLALRGGD